MSHSNLGYHHWHKRTGKRRAGEKGVRSDKFKRFIDALISYSTILMVLTYVPQVYVIWIIHQYQGVSFWSWAAFLVSSLFWVFYGYIHRSRAIILMNASVAVMQFCVIVGILVKP